MSESRFDIAWSQLLTELPFFGALMFRLEMIESDSIETAGTNGQQLIYSPVFFESLNLKEVKFVFCHEILHCTLEHVTRGELFEYNDKFQIAADYVVNITLDPLVKRGIIERPECGLHDSKYEDKTVDEVYAMLPDPPEEDIDNGDTNTDGSSGGSDDDESDEGGESTANDSESQDEAENEISDQKSDSGKLGGDSQTDAESVNDPGGCGKVFAPTNDDGEMMGEQEQKEFAHGWNDAAYTAAQLATNQGKGDAELAENLLEQMKPRENWKRIVHDFFTQVMRSVWNWKKPNKRHLHRGIILPSRQSTGIGRIGVCIDSSGSVSDYLLSGFLGYLDDLLLQFKDLELVVVMFHSRVYAVHTYTAADIPIKVPRISKGGTYFPAPIAELQRYHLENQPIHGCVFLTDMECYSYPELPPEFPILWCYPVATSKCWLHTPYGRNVEIDPTD